MEVIQLATPAHFPGRGQIERVGLHRNRLFVALRNVKELEVWSVHCLVPGSWARLFAYQFHELFYAHCALSPAKSAVFAMTAAFFETGSPVEDGGIRILRYDLDREQLDVFELDPEAVDRFEEVTLERVGIGCGPAAGQLFLYDRTMVTGQIPFWHISLHWDTMTFSIKSSPILDDQQLCAHCVRFPVVLNGDNRTALRITNDYQVAVYDGDTDRWELLAPEEGADLDVIE